MTEVVHADLFAFWSQTDPVGKSVLLVVLIMSVATWSLMLFKAVRIWTIRRTGVRVLDAFWNAPDLQQAAQAAQRARGAGRHNPFSELAAAAAGAQRAASDERHTLARALEPQDYTASMLRGALHRGARELESGLSVLASVGATAPFVGLFGTVWGIYHALAAIGASGQASLDQVAGPVGEALVMTALGIAVAVPAVLAYNFLLRANRDLGRALDGFAQDLHAFAVQSSDARALPAEAVEHALAASVGGS
jgi:biopolymer transport protein ExbB